MKLIAQIFIAVLLALLVNDQINRFMLTYELRLEIEKLEEQQQARRQIQLEKEAQKRKLNAPESAIDWSNDKARTEKTNNILDQLIDGKN